MAYEKVFEKPYPQWHDLPLEDTPVRASAFEEYDSTLQHIENFLDGSTALKPVSKGSAMTQQVGVDENGQLFTAPSGGGGGGTAATTSFDDTTSELGVNNVQDAIDRVKVIATSIQPVVKTSAMTQAVGKDNEGKLWTEPGGGGGGNYVSKTGDTMTGSLTVPDITVGSRDSEYTVGENSSTFGANNKVTGQSSIAAGANNNIPANIAGAIGSGNVVNSQGGFAAGIGNIASGVYSQAFGLSNVTSSPGQLVCGEYNNTDSSDIIEAGNGTSRLRSNAFSVDKTGNVKMAGHITTSDVTTMSSSDYVYVTVSGEIKKITIANLKTVLGIS